MWSTRHIPPFPRSWIYPWPIDLNNFGSILDPVAVGGPTEHASSLQGQVYYANWL
jgi:hypothetical protein